MIERSALPVSAVILAGGSSSRMGMPKQTLLFNGTSLLRRIALAALGAGCFPVVVVTGANAELSKRELDGLAIREAYNPLWETGMASSIRTGLNVVLEDGAASSAALFLVCDQPHVTSEIISKLAEAYRNSGKPVIASKYGDTFGVPALFDRELFPELLRLEGSEGAKQLIKKHASDALFLPFNGGEVDIDTPQDFSRLIEKYVPNDQL